MHSTEKVAAALARGYTIERTLGAGGMATVYLAHDLKHDRKVAIKVLKPELAAVLGAERFVVEIKTTASLQHPHILPLFDSGEADGFLYYVMPYIEGETIREKLNRETQFGVDEAVRITREIADALDYAHRRGVIHRDIKPENLLLHDGRAMVMDFGIALAVSAAAGGRMTETGLSLGTPHYMSPEQATAEKDITPRSDIYSLASVLYEMLSGQPPHLGGAAQQVIMKIITETARPVNQLRRNVPPNVVSALEKALEKVPADRFENAKAFGEALSSGSFSYATTTGTAAVAGTRSRIGGPRVAMAGWLLAIVATGAAVMALLNRPVEPTVRRLDLSIGTVIPAISGDMEISPDGTTLAMTGRVGLDYAIFARHLDGDPEFRMVPGTEGGQAPSFSPDNQWIVFRRSTDSSLVKVNINGGGAVTLVPRASRLDPWYPHWGDDGRIVFAAPRGAGIVSASGGKVTPLPQIGPSMRPFLLPDGSGVLFNRPGGVFLYDFQTDSSVRLLDGAHAVYVPTGHLLYSTTEGGLFAVPFDLKRHRLTGSPVRVLERVGSGASSRGYAVSHNGMVVQHDAPVNGSGGPNQLVIIDPSGGADTIRLPVGRYLLPRFSRDGRRVAMEMVAREGASDIYTVDRVAGTVTQITFDSDNDKPVWSPDGKTIAYDRTVGTKPNSDSGTGEGLFVKPADNSGPERRVTSMLSPEIGLEQWIDDKRLLYSALTEGGGRGIADIFTVSIDSESRPVPYVQTPFSELEPRLSPDGTLLVFNSSETGGYQLWMRDFPVPQGKWNLSRARASAPRWAPDGKSVLFWRGGIPFDSLFRVRIDRTPNVVVHDAEFVLAMDADGLSNWDLHPDGRRFVVAVPAAASTSSASAVAPGRYLIIENWFSELRRLSAGK